MPKSDSKPGPNPKFVKLCQVICEELKRGIDKSYNKFYKLYNGKFKGLVIFKLKRILQRQPQKEEIQEVLTDFWSRAHKQNHFCDAKYEIYFINTLTRICLDVLKKVIKQRKIEENEIEISNDNFIEDDKFRILQTPVAELKKKEPLLIASLCWLKFSDYFKQIKKLSIYFEQKAVVALLPRMGFLRHGVGSLE